ncbi:hypothetical protein EU513_13795 [Yimella sp. RIT 621]|uniref:hypothetical protein n=1 Tax=Yimella sp. RIT 621 TaxID=2510323 RepID=UPI00101C4AFA|nr:hypothetical protein [Yimella sp. RIT 621]RYG76122.1 hypothetical protein EU513_13795 [Yimella sp. RIT 621]
MTNNAAMSGQSAGAADRRYCIETRRVLDPSPGMVQPTPKTVIKVTWANGRSFTREISQQPAITAYGISFTLRNIGIIGGAMTTLLMVLALVGYRDAGMLAAVAAIVAAVCLWIDRMTMPVKTTDELEKVTTLADTLGAGLRLDPDNTDIMVAARQFMRALEARDTSRVVGMAQQLDAILGTTPGQRDGLELHPADVLEIGQESHTTMADAAGALRAAGQTGNAAVVDRVDTRYHRLTPDEQVTAESAARTILEALTTLAELPDHLAGQPGPDGSTPRDDADASVKAALLVLRTLSDDTYRDETDQLRVLRRYARQWEPNPLDLEGPIRGE